MLISGPQHAGRGDAEGSGGAAVEQLLGEPVQLHAGALAVGQHRVDPRPRAADRGDPVQGVLAAEDRERARAAGQPDDATRVAQQDLPDAGIVLVTLVAQPTLRFPEVRSCGKLTLVASTASMCPEL